MQNLLETGRSEWIYNDAGRQLDKMSSELGTFGFAFCCRAILLKEVYYHGKNNTYPSYS